MHKSQKKTKKNGKVIKDCCFVVFDRVVVCLLSQMLFRCSSFVLSRFFLIMVLASVFVSRSNVDVKIIDLI